VTVSGPLENLTLLTQRSWKLIPRFRLFFMTLKLEKTKGRPLSDMARERQIEFADNHPSPEKGHYSVKYNEWIHLLITSLLGSPGDGLGSTSSNACRPLISAGIHFLLPL
jgi:hypothetical protein